MNSTDPQWYDKDKDGSQSKIRISLQINITLQIQIRKVLRDWGYQTLQEKSTNTLKLCLSTKYDGRNRLRQYFPSWYEVSLWLIYLFVPMFIISQSTLYLRTLLPPSENHRDTSKMKWISPVYEHFCLYTFIDVQWLISVSNKHPD